MKKIAPGFLILLSCLRVVTVASDPLRAGTIRGIVQTDDGNRLSGVIILISGTNIHTVCNERGEYTLEHVPVSKSFLVMASLEGFDVNMKSARVQEGEILQLDFTLKLPEINQEVTVYAKTPVMIDTTKSIGELKFSPVELNKLPTIGERDVFRTMQWMPGISGSNESSSGLYIRGGTPDKNLILYDGFSIYHVDHFFGIFSAFNPNAIENISLYKGGFESKFGGRTSSVMDIEGKTGRRNGFNAGAGFSLLSFNGLVDVPLGNRSSLLITGRKSFKSALYENIFNKYGNQSETVLRGPGGGQGPADGSGQIFSAQFENDPSSYFYDVNAKWEYRPSDKDSLFVSLFNGRDDLDNSRTMGAPPFLTDEGIDFDNEISDVTAWGNLAVGINWRRQWNDADYSQLSVSHSNYFNNRDNGANMSIGPPPEDSEETEETKSIQRESQDRNRVKDLTIRIDNAFRLANWNQMEFGAQVTRNDIDYSYVYSNAENGLPIPGRGGFNRIADDMSRSDSGTTYSVYLQERLKFSSLVTLLPGLRLTYFDKTRAVYSEPRFSLTLNVSEKLKLKGALGRYYQFATQMSREDNMLGNRDFWALADGQTIPVGSSTHVISGISYETEDWLFDVEAYRKSLKGLSEFTLRFAPFEGGIDYSDYFFEGTGTAKGVEVLAQRKFGRFTGWFTYCLGKVEYRFPEYGDQPFPASHDVTHELKLVSSYQIKRWNLASTFIFATGRPYTEPTGVEQISMDDDRSFYRVIFGSKNTARLPSYIRLDLSATYDFPLGGSRASISASVFNLLNRGNVWYKEFEVVEGSMLETDVTYMGITPNISFTVYLK